MEVTVDVMVMDSCGIRYARDFSCNSTNFALYY